MTPKSHLDTQEGWCDTGATIQDNNHTWPVKCIQPEGHNGAHTWTTYRPDSIWTAEGAVIRLEDEEGSL